MRKLNSIARNFGMVLGVALLSCAGYLMAEVKSDRVIPEEFWKGAEQAAETSEQPLLMAGVSTTDTVGYCFRYCGVTGGSRSCRDFCF